jgi:hypothetical protein
LFLDKPNHKVWVKNWSEIIRECEARLKFIEKTLNIEVSAAELGERIEQLKSSILKLGRAAHWGCNERDK